MLKFFQLSLVWPAILPLEGHWLLSLSMLCHSALLELVSDLFVLGCEVVLCLGFFSGLFCCCCWFGWVFLIYFLRRKADRFPASVLNVTLFGKQCWLPSLSNCAKLKRQLKKRLILEIFPEPNFLMKNSLEKRFIAQSLLRARTLFMPQLLAFIALFTSKINLTVFVFLAERFWVHVFKNPS